jgi:hypothetical protein
MTTPRKLMLAVAILATGLVSSASASTHGESTYYDTIRPHGHPRSDAIYNANVNACYSSSGESRTAVYDTPAFKQCMLSRGYRFEYTKVVQDPPRAKQVASRIPVKGNFIDPDTGLSCTNTGWATICDGGVASGDDEPASTAQDNNDWAAQQEQSAMDAANAGYAQDAATAAANVAAAATFDAQMTVGN